MPPRVWPLGQNSAGVTSAFDEISTETEMFTCIRLNDNVILKSTRTTRSIGS